MFAGEAFCEIDLITFSESSKSSSETFSRNQPPLQGKAFIITLKNLHILQLIYIIQTSKKSKQSLKICCKIRRNCRILVLKT